MKIAIFGSTGMVGKGILYECLESDKVTEIIAVNRSPLGMNHPKLREIIHSDFFDPSTIENDLTGLDACFFPLGVSVVGMSEKEYTRITYDLTIGIAKTLARLNSDMTFCYVSGVGTDSTEKGRSMWARVKGRTENELLAMPFKNAYMFRPGYIQPMKGIKSKTAWYNAMYVVAKPLYFIFKALAPNSVTTTVTIGQAMINCVAGNGEKKVLDVREINELGDRGIGGL